MTQASPKAPINNSISPIVSKSKPEVAEAVVEEEPTVENVELEVADENGIEAEEK